MSPSAHRHSGAPTFTSASASLSLSGLDPHFGSASIDPDLLEATASAWYTEAGELHHPPVSPHNAQFNMNFGPSFASHGVPASHDALHRQQYNPISLNATMNGIPYHNHPFSSTHPTRTRPDELTPIPPLEATYPPTNPYITPYPDSTASSAPSEDLLIVGSDAASIIVDAADEDKRKRNQAASARFRQKKKQREQQMLEQARENADKLRRLETENGELKRENAFLKRLLVERVENMGVEDKEALIKLGQGKK